MPVRAIVFDFDGLILDTERSSYQAWCETFERHGATPPTVEEWALEIGTDSALDIVGMLRERTGRAVDVDELHRARRRRRNELLAVEELLPGVEEWLEEAHALGLGVAVASSSPVEWVRGHLERFDLVDRFACLSCFGPGLHAKPAPDLYLAACGQLGVAPAEAVAVEDSRNGLLAAKAAGMACIVVPHDLTAHLDLSAADLRLTSLAEMSLADALGRL